MRVRACEKVRPAFYNTAVVNAEQDRRDDGTR